MSGFISRTNKWKFLSFALMGILASGFLVPSALGQPRPGPPEVWEAIDDLQQKITDIEPTPGPQGEPGADGQDGEDGTNGQDGLNCWDLNDDGVKDDSEDINNDGVHDAQDCQGPQGEQGIAGEDGQDADVSALEAQIAELEARVAELESQNAVLESIVVTAIDNEGHPNDPILLYTATAFYSDGSSADVTDLAGWESLNEDAVLTVGGGEFWCNTSPSDDGDTIRAIYEGESDTELAFCEA